MRSSRTGVGAMCRVLLCMGCCSLLFDGSGCSGSGSSTRPVVHGEGQRSKSAIAEEMAGAQAITREGVTVYCSEGLGRQAERLAGLIARQLSDIRAATAFEFTVKQVNVYLKSVERVAPSLGPGGKFRLSNTACCMELFVEPGGTSCEDIVALNRIYPYIFVHELVEWSLFKGGPRPRLLLDYRRRTFWGRTRDEFHYTRWFREGFACYAGVLACKTTVVGDGSGREKILSEVLQRKLDQNPFTALASVGKGMFVWHQYQDHAGYPVGQAPPDAYSTENNHYDAALGLFLVIERRYGQHAIREIIQKVNKLENGTGEDVKRIVSQVLGTDIVEFAEAFRFPKTGLDMVAVYPPYPLPGFTIKEGLWVVDVGVDSPAQRAGIRTGDVVVSLDSDRTVTNFVFELALYKRMHQQSVRIGIWRKGAGHMTVEMNLRE